MYNSARSDIFSQKNSSAVCRTAQITDKARLRQERGFVSDLSASVGDDVFVIELIFDRCIISLTGIHSSME